MSGSYWHPAAAADDDGYGVGATLLLLLVTALECTYLRSLVERQ
jgi:hypothetical protein